MDLSFKGHPWLRKALQLIVHQSKVKVFIHLDVQSNRTAGGEASWSEKSPRSQWSLTELHRSSMEMGRDSESQTLLQLCTKNGLYGRMGRWKSLGRQTHRTGRTGIFKAIFSRKFCLCAPQVVLVTLFRRVCSFKIRSTQMDSDKDGRRNGRHLSGLMGWTLLPSVDWCRKKVVCHFVTLRNCEKLKRVWILPYPL